jgi:hypothetical protein
MEITKEYLQAEISRMEQQRNHAHDIAVASQAAIDVLTSLVARLDMQAVKLSDLGLPDPQPLEG